MMIKTPSQFFEMGSYPTLGLVSVRLVFDRVIAV